MNRSLEFIKNRDYMLQHHNQCEKCGRKVGLEVHHVLPVINGGSHDINNLQVLCGICHNERHEYDRSYLTKKGIEKARKIKCEKLISVYEFYKQLQQVQDNNVDIIDILDIIDNLPIRGTRALREV